MIFTVVAATDSLLIVSFLLVPHSYEVKPPEQQINFIHYDPEMHWCQTCQVFPKTAKDFLTHLHTKDHQQMQKTIESPWHDHPPTDVSPDIRIAFLNPE